MSEFAVQDGTPHLANLLGNVYEIAANRTRESPRREFGVIFNYVIETTPQPTCAVYLRNGRFQTAGEYIRSLGNEARCHATGLDVLVLFYKILEQRYSFVSSFDKALFAHYPDDEIRAFYQEASINPVHVFLSKSELEGFSSGFTHGLVSQILPVTVYDNAAETSLQDIANNLGFFGEDAWKALWTLNHDSLSDPFRVPSNADLVVPDVPNSTEDWVGPIRVDDDTSYEISKEVYDDYLAHDLVARVIEGVKNFGVEEIFLPNYKERGMRFEEVWLRE